FCAKDAACTQIYTLSLHDALPIYKAVQQVYKQQADQGDKPPPEKRVVPLQQRGGFGTQCVLPSVIDAPAKVQNTIKQVPPDERDQRNHNHTRDFLGGGKMRKGAAQQADIAAAHPLCGISIHTVYCKHAIATFSGVAPAPAIGADARIAAINTLFAAVCNRAASGVGASGA